MGDRMKVLNLRTSGTTNNNIEISPKFPVSDSLEYGEIAVSYFKDAEALSFKNHQDEIVDFRPNKYYEKKFDEVNQTIEDDELVISSALSDLNTRINDIPDEVEIGETIIGTPEIFIDTSENNAVEIYTKAQVDDISTTTLANAKTYANEESKTVFIGNESTNEKGILLVDTSVDTGLEVYTKAQVDAIIAQLESRIAALEQ
jgi:hypothetical protein